MTEDDHGSSRDRPRGALVRLACGDAVGLRRPLPRVTPFFEGCLAVAPEHSTRARWTVGTVVGDRRAIGFFLAT